MQKMVDLRSDTVTRPTDSMRRAMASAEVGDDVYGEDPTVNHLEELAAERMGKEAGLFIPSGTMGNLIAVLAHCQRGDEAIMGNLAHTFLFEAGGVSALGGVMAHTLPNQPDGTLRLEDIRSAIRPNDVHHPVSRLLILENTHNRCGGVILSQEYTQAAAQLAHGVGLQVHLDGARLFNAAVASGVAVKSLAEPVDSVTFCLSKGLAAPVGSVLCGSHDFINRARRLRKQLGGGMRQAGILAAAGIVAMNEMVDRLDEDHRRARKLADCLQTVPGLNLPFGMPPTNMTFIGLDEPMRTQAEKVAESLRQAGVLVGVVGPGRFRLVTHWGIEDEDIDIVAEAFQQAVAG